MSTAKAAELQVALEGVPLPATKHALLEYAREQDPDAARLLQALPDREYRSLDEVGEALAPVQPRRGQAALQMPHEESGSPPGGEAYFDPNPESGEVRPTAPPENPPQKQLEQQTKTQQVQQQRQEEELPD
jgi:uncharacterized protein DUF2795